MNNDQNNNVINNTTTVNSNLNINNSSSINGSVNNVPINNQVASNVTLAQNTVEQSGPTIINQASQNQSSLVPEYNVNNQISTVNQSNNDSNLGTVTNNPPPTVPIITSVVDDGKKDEVKVVYKNSPKKKSPLLFIILLGLAIYTFYSNYTYKNSIESIRNSCSPITASLNETKLDVDSTLVKDLYDKVSTNVREDVAQPEFNDNLKVYLAYRQINEDKKNNTQCNMFNNVSMEPYKCEVSDTFTPKTIKEDDYKLEWKKLFGEETEPILENIKLQNGCIGGYQYIKDRGEFVQGYCTNQNTTSIKAEKKIVEAISKRNTITIKEDVKYLSPNNNDVPDYLKNGYYYYIFKLDMNYNYVLVDRKYESKY